MGDLVGIERIPHRCKTSVITIGPDDGPGIFPAPFFTGLFQKIKFTFPAFPATPGHQSVGNSFTVNSESA